MIEFNRFGIVQGWYWWLADHHEGQASATYARLSRVSGYYKPGPLENGPDEFCSISVYNNLCDKRGCTHERLEEGE